MKFQYWWAHTCWFCVTSMILISPFIQNIFCLLGHKKVKNYLGKYSWVVLHFFIFPSWPNFYNTLQMMCVPNKASVLFFKLWNFRMTREIQEPTKRPLYFRGRDAESNDGVPVPHPLRGPQTAETRREAAVLQEQLAALRRVVLCARQRRLRIRKTLLGGWMPETLTHTTALDFCLRKSEEVLSLALNVANVTLSGQRRWK